MSWQIFVALSLLLYLLNGLFHRVLMRQESSDPYAQTIAFYGLGGIFALIVTTFRGGFHYQVAPHLIPYFILLTVFATIATVLGFKAFKLIEASETSILLSSSRLWMVFGAFMFLQESFSFNKIIGALIIIVGITIAQWKKQKFEFNRGTTFALIAALFYALAEIFCFYILRDFDATSFSVYSSLLPVVTLLILFPKSIKKLAFYFKPSRALNISIVSINDTLATIFLFVAYQLGRNASQIGPLMATQTIVTVILAIIFLRERDNMVNKILGALLVVAGVIVVSL